MKIQELSLEITRKCGCGCAGCFRGCGGGISVSREVLEHVFDGVSEIMCLNLCGGEPLADAEALELLYDVIRGCATKIRNFRCISSFEVPDLERSMKAMDLLHEIMSSSYQDTLVLSPFADKIMPDALMVMANIHPYVTESFKKLDETFSQYIKNKKFPRCLEGFHRPAFLTGFSKSFDTVVTPVRVAANGNVVSSDLLSYATEDIGEAVFGNVLKSNLAMVINGNLKSPGQIRELEVLPKGQMSFSQYWDSLDEENRGDYFGYVFYKTYDRNLIGFGIFKMLEHHQSLKEIPEFADFLNLLGLLSAVPPAWADKDDLEWEPKVREELNGYIKLICQRIFSANPVFEIIDIYYRDMPHTANMKLFGFIEGLASTHLG